jgi:hypothetical protein
MLKRSVKNGEFYKEWYILFVTAVRQWSHHKSRAPSPLNASRPMNEHDVNANLQILSSSFVDHKFLPVYKDSFPPHMSSNGRQLKPIDHDNEVPRESCVSPLTSKKQEHVIVFYSPALKPLGVYSYSCEGHFYHFPEAELDSSKEWHSFL